MNGLNDENAGVLTALSEPMDIGIPSAVVFLIKNGIGFAFSSKPPPSTSLVLSSTRGADCSSLKRSVTTTLGARDLVVIVLKIELIIARLHVPNLVE